jgi:hypothetical protein
MRKLLIGVGIAVVVLAGVAVAADRIGVDVAEKEVEKQITAELASQKLTTSAPPQVRINGVPFLTQALDGNYDSIEVDLADLRGAEIPLQEVHAVGEDVRLPLSEVIDRKPKPVATKAHGTATIAYAELVKIIQANAPQGFDLSGLTLSGAGGSDLTASIDANDLGLGKVTGVGKITVVNGALRVQITSLKTSDGVFSGAAQLIIDRIIDRLVFEDIKLPQLPFKLALTGLAADPAALQLTFEASEVALTEPVR